MTHWGIGVASTGSTKLLYSGPVGLNKGAATALASTDVFTSPSYTPTNDDRVSFDTPVGGTLPAGLTVGVVYFVINASGNTFKVSTTLAGSAVDITANGDVLVFQHTPFVVTSAPSYTPQLNTSSTITEK